MNRDRLIEILADVNAAAEDKAAALDALSGLPIDERMKIMREAVAMQTMMLDLQAQEKGKPFSGKRLAPADASASLTGADITPTLPATSDAVPTCPNLQDASDWPDQEIPLDELWAYYYEDSIGDAKLYKRMNHGRIVYVQDWCRFLVWQGHHWTEDNFSVSFQRVAALIDQYIRLLREKNAVAEDATATREDRESAEKKAQEIRKRIKMLRSNLGQKYLLEQVTRIYDPMVVLPDQIDTDPYLLPCPNGVINLKTGELLPGRSEDYLRVSCKTPFEPSLLEVDDPCPEVNRFLLASMNGDQEMVDYIWRILGYGLIRKRDEHVFFIFWGPHGRNGKDTLIKLVSRTLGDDLSSNVQVEMFLQTAQTKNSSAPSPDVLALKGMAIAWLNEAEDGQRFAMSKVKQYSGGGKITGRGLLDKKITEFYQTHLPIMCTNELPKARGDDDAFWSRIKIVRWELSFVEEPKEDYQRKADTRLDEKLQVEVKGVLARMVRGALEYQRDGLNAPAKVKRWTSDVRDRFDDLSEFLEECCIIDLKDKDMKISAKDLNCAWNLWYGTNRDRTRIPSARTLGTMLDKREIPKKLSNGTWRIGISLRPEWANNVQEELERQECKRNTSSRFQGSL